MNQALSDLLDLLDLEQIEENIFRGQSRSAVVPRVFGGQVAAQALVAAGRTVPADRHAHSLHAYFLRPGDPGAPIVYTVERIRDGRSFTTRRAVAVQHGRPIFTLSASFQVDEEGLEHQAPMPPAPDPATLPTSADRFRDYGHLAPAVVEKFLEAREAIDLRYVEEPPFGKYGEPREPHSQVWFRTNGKLDDDPPPDSVWGDPQLHIVLAAYISDMTLLDSVLLAHGRGGWAVGDVVGASLDHAMWFHRPFRADEWLLYDQESPSAHGGRGLGQARIYTQDGSLAISVIQEGVVRVPR
ncbi:acyl-CoA thioesterase [Streptomyces shenzhenensis]|uniref:acyl-CoA thioesterase n=1 Tax=Streptomyces shenzhenensis TaxID=943815 RepID=UPI0015F1103A|nr:acyl-CoA thioesterase II [Streptomyces shenzhenensis]